MTTKEQQSIDSLHKILREIRDENNRFKEDTKLLVDKLNTKVEKKHLPVYLEQDLLSITQQAIRTSIEKVLVDYNSPLNKLVKTVIEENSMELKKLISDSFMQVIRVSDFKQSIVDAFSHKIARSIISNNDGLFDKVSNELRQDTIFKSKMALAVSNVVEECLSKKNA